MCIGEVGCSCDDSGGDRQRGHRAVSAVAFNSAFNILCRKLVKIKKRAGFRLEVPFKGLQRRT